MNDSNGYYKKFTVIDNRIGGLAAFFLYIGTVFAANWAITNIGIVPVGFGLMAPAGVFFAGLAFTLRDLTHEALGRKAVLVAILIGASLSSLLSPALAVASGAAFLLSELADFAVYTPLRQKSWLGAVALSNTVGLTIDSALFLWLAFGSLDFMPAWRSARTSMGRVLSAGCVARKCRPGSGTWRQHEAHGVLSGADRRPDL